MGGIFNYDSPLMSGLGKLTDLVILNLLTLLFCIPIVTIGASITAAHYVALKIRRGEGYVWKNFWKSFKENIKQSTLLWLLYVVFIVVSVFSYFTASSYMGGTMGSIICGVIFVGVLFAMMTSVWVWPVQSRFINTISNTIKNAFLMAFKYLFRTILMIIISLVPVVLALVLNYQWWSILLLFCFAVPIYLCAMLYDKKFEAIEEMILNRQTEETEEATEGLS